MDCPVVINAYSTALMYMVYYEDPITSLASRSGLFSISLNYTSRLQFALPIKYVGMQT